MHFRERFNIDDISDLKFIFPLKCINSKITHAYYNDIVIYTVSLTDNNNNYIYRPIELERT